MKRVLIPLPERDFDPSEAAVSWRILTDANVRVTFATPQGAPSQADPLLLTGDGLDAWSRIPALASMKFLGLILRANRSARRDYARMSADEAFRKPIPFAAIDTTQFDGLLLPGGHCARGMRPYLEDQLLQSKVASSLLHPNLSPPSATESSSPPAAFHPRPAKAFSTAAKRPPSPGNSSPPPGI